MKKMSCSMIFSPIEWFMKQNIYVSTILNTRKHFVIDSDVIFKINRILFVEGTFYFYCSEYAILEFDSFYYAYKIREKLPRQNKILQFDELEQKTPFEKKKA